MKKITFLFVFAFLFFDGYSQNFTWMHGGTISGVVPGTYGTQGVAAPLNNPGTRHGAAHWVDASGNLWLFGGEGNDMSGSFGWLSDLWKYDISTNQWAWMAGSTSTNQVSTYGTQGTAAASNWPGAREFAISWVDASGKFWMLGGDGFASTSTFGRLGDLWKYDPVTQLWTWMHGFNTVDQSGVYGAIGVASATNKPGARYGAGTWVDASGRLCLFGGKGFDNSGTNNALSDMWRYDVGTNQWTWISGSNTAAQTGAYGTMGQASIANMPGSREFPATWMDAQGNVYFFGGLGFANSISGYLNDLWKFDPASGAWTWLTGANTTNQPGAYGTMGTGAATVSPGARFASAAWADDSGNFWLFGGRGFSSGTSASHMNDLFKYNPCANEWTWIKGSNAPAPTAVYGTQGTPAAANTPGGREYNIYWKGANNTFWLFGGLGAGANTTFDNTNDLWRFTPPCYHGTIAATSNTVCSGNTLTLSIPGICSGPVQWYNSPTGSTSIGSGLNYITTPTAATSSSVYTVYAEAASCTVSPRGAQTITVYPAPGLTVSAPNLCEGALTTLTVSGASTYTWNGNTVANSIDIIPALPDYNYTISGTNAYGCEKAESATLTVSGLPTLNIVSSNPQTLCANSVASLTASGAATYSWDNGPTTAVITITPSVDNTYMVTGAAALGCQSSTVFTQTVIPLPVLSVTVSHALCKGATAILTANGASSYVWQNGATSPTLSITGVLPAYTYSLQGSDANGCTSLFTGTLSVSPCLGISELNITGSLKLYPNPCNGNFMIELADEADATLIIYNIAGQKEAERLLTKGINPVTTPLTRGIYFYEVKVSGVTAASGKVLVE